MQLEPKDLYQKLEYDKVLQLLEKECVGQLAKEAISDIAPQTDKGWIENQLIEVKEFKLSIEENDRFPIGAYENTADDLRMLEIEGYVLDVEGLQRINKTMQLIQGIFKFFTNTRQEIYPRLHRIISRIDFDEALIREINRVIDEEGNIRPDASPELLRIRKMMVSKQNELEKQFRTLINRYRNKGWLTDNVESFRNGRRVLSVPSEHKRKIRGIIHDESTTGKTAFIEPEGVIDINNDIFDLETEERREIYRILKELSAMLRPYIPLLRLYQDLLIRYDLISAKARLASRMNANMPKLQAGPNFGIQEGYHPLLLLKNAQLGKVTVPFDLKLLGNNRIVILSGPNAGGKSITMKSVGLLQLMLQAGMLIPVDQESEFGIFEKIFADIGDQQSLEDDLSTYSSRLQNAKIFLEKADDKTLILIDEFGSGTDPKIGGAIAESILRELNFRKIFGIITTHYSNLKIFAFKTKGIVNGSMTFDRKSLNPTYEFRVGRPGSSYAFEIAEKSGLNGKVLEYAQKRTGENQKAVDQLLVELQRERQELEEKMTNLLERERKLDKLVKTYEQMHRELDVRRKKLKLENKEQALQQVAKDNKQLENLIREIREQQNLEKAKALAAEAKTERKELSEQVQDLREEVYYKPKSTVVEERPIREGDYVKLKTGGATGFVETIERKKAMVLMGEMRMTIKLKDLELAKAPLEVRSTKSITADTLGAQADFKSKIDIRGMRYDEAMLLVEEFIDQALINNTSNLRIVHGKGTGVLRQAVRRKLREYNVEMNVRHPHAEDGGDGVTIIEL